MRNRSSGINTVLTILLFCIFALTALWTVSASVGIYRQDQAAAGANNSSRIITSYIREKVRQADPGTVSIGSIGGSRAIVIAQPDGVYCTYIYQYGGRLMEQYVQSGAAAAPEGGTEIAEAGSLRFETVRDGIIKVTCSAGEGSSDTVYISV